jgi:hypothetical protein
VASAVLYGGVSGRRRGGVSGQRRASPAGAPRRVAASTASRWGNLDLATVGNGGRAEVCGRRGLRASPGSDVNRGRGGRGWEVAAERASPVGGGRRRG